MDGFEGKSSLLTNGNVEKLFGKMSDEIRDCRSWIYDDGSVEFMVIVPKENRTIFGIKVIHT